MDIKWRTKTDKRMTKITSKNGVTYLTFDLFEKEHLVHGFSTRLGGVSQSYLSSMNLSFTRGDKPENVHENYHRIAGAIGFDEKRLVFSDQQHHINILKVTEKDLGKGITCERDYADIDGLMTNEPNIPLVTFYADCVPLLFYDPVKKVIAASHSGWRGTCSKIGIVTVKKMKEVYGCDPKDVLVVIGPSICQKCYEVSEDVYEQFKLSYAENELENIFEKKENHKYQLDLAKANEINFYHAGITKEHLQMPDLCTCCNPEFLYSHRASNGKRGNLAAFLML